MERLELLANSQKAKFQEDIKTNKENIIILTWLEIPYLRKLKILKKVIH